MTIVPVKPTKPIVITGVMAAGKSTVAEALARRFPKSVHLRGDAFRRMIVSGRIEITAEAPAEALAQLEMRYAAAAAAARAYLASGFTVVHQDVIIGRALADFIANYRHTGLYLVVLCPNADAVRRREAARAKKGYHGFTVEQLEQVFRAETPRLGLWLDNSTLTVEETVERILRSLDAAEVPVGQH